MSSTHSDDDTRLVARNEDGSVVASTPPEDVVPSPSEQEPRPQKKAKLTWNQVAGSIGAGFAAASTGACVSFTAVTQPQFETEENPKLRMDLETASWFGKAHFSFCCLQLFEYSFQA